MPRKYKGGHKQAQDFKRYGIFEEPVKLYKGKVDLKQRELTEFIKKEKGKRTPKVS